MTNEQIRQLIENRKLQIAEEKEKLQLLEELSKLNIELLDLQIENNAIEAQLGIHSEQSTSDSETHEDNVLFSSIESLPQQQDVTRDIQDISEIKEVKLSKKYMGKESIDKMWDDMMINYKPKEDKPIQTSEPPEPPEYIKSTNRYLDMVDELITPISADNIPSEPPKSKEPELTEEQKKYHKYLDDLFTF